MKLASSEAKNDAALARRRLLSLPELNVRYRGNAEKWQRTMTAASVGIDPEQTLLNCDKLSANDPLAFSKGFATLQNCLLPCLRTKRGRDMKIKFMYLLMVVMSLVAGMQVAYACKAGGQSCSSDSDCCSKSGCTYAGTCSYGAVMVSYAGTIKTAPAVSTAICVKATGSKSQRQLGEPEKQIALKCRCCGWQTERGIDGKNHQVCNHQCCN
jgi:hypothetical protein